MMLQKGLQRATKNTISVEVDFEKALKSVPGAGKVANETASRAKALKCMMMKNKSASADMLAMDRSFGSDPAAVSWIFKHVDRVRKAVRTVLKQVNGR